MDRFLKEMIDDAIARVNSSEIDADKGGKCKKSDRSECEKMSDEKDDEE